MAYYLGFGQIRSIMYRQERKYETRSCCLGRVFYEERNHLKKSFWQKQSVLKLNVFLLSEPLFIIKIHLCTIMHVRSWTGLIVYFQWKAIICICSKEYGKTGQTTVEHGLWQFLLVMSAMPCRTKVTIPPEKGILICSEAREREILLTTHNIKHNDKIVHIIIVSK